MMARWERLAVKAAKLERRYLHRFHSLPIWTRDRAEKRTKNIYRKMRSARLQAALAAQDGGITVEQFQAIYRPIAFPKTNNQGGFGPRGG